MSEMSFASLMPVVLPGLRIVQVSGSSYGLFLSITSAIKLDSYTSTTNKLEKVDPTGTVKAEVAKTTQAASVSVLISVFGFASLIYILALSKQKSGIVGYLSLFNTFLTCLSYTQIAAWLNPKNKKNPTESQGRGKQVSGVGTYMQAWQRMEKLKTLQLALGGFWTISTMIASASN